MHLEIFFQNESMQCCQGLAVDQNTPFDDYIRERITQRLVYFEQSNPGYTVEQLIRSMKVFMEGLKFNPKRLEEIVLSRKIFRPSKLIAVSISSETYCELQRLQDYSEFKNLEHLRKDRFLFEHGVNCLGVKDVRHLRDPDRDDLLRMFKRLTSECLANYEAGHRTAVIFMYSGHGIASDLTFALMNTIDPKKILFPIEKKIRQISELPGTYVISLFNCCRDKVKVARSKGGKTTMEQSDDH